MKSRFLSLLVVPFLAASCGGETADEMAADAAAEAAAPAESATMSADEAAIDEFRASFAQHYNLHHPDMVADMYVDTATFLAADGVVYEGREEILGALQAQMEGSPTLELTGRDMMVFGDIAVSLGDYSVQTTDPEGVAMTATGHYMTGFERQADGWKILGVITNYNTDPPMPRAEAEESEPPAEDGTMTALIEAYETHFNLGHADMVADLFTDDAKVAFANLPFGEGRAAVVSSLESRFAMGDSPQVDIHDVYTMELGDGTWAVDAGWFEITAGASGMNGSYISLNQQQPDGSWKMHWLVSNGHPTDG